MSAIRMIDEFRAFMDFAEDNGLYSRERVLWVALFHLASKKATYNAATGEYDWEEDFFPVSMSKLGLHTGMDKKGIEEARNKLKQRGLIDFRPGERKKRDPLYKILYFTSPMAPQSLSNGSPMAPQSLSNGTPKGSPSNNDYVYIYDYIRDSGTFKKRFGINDNYRNSTPARRATAGMLVEILEKQKPEVIVPIPNAFDLINQALVYPLTPYMVYRLAMESRDFIGFMEAMEEPPAWAKEQALAERRALDGSDQLG